MSENGGDWVVETKPVVSTVIPTTEAQLAREERLRPIQRAYRETSSEPERRALALEFANVARVVSVERPRGAVGESCGGGDATVPVADFLAANLRHQ